MSEPVFPPSGGTLWRESRMDFDADDFARLAHDLYDQPNLQTTLDKIVESAVGALGCDYAGLLVTRKGHQLVAISATDPAAEKADKLQIELPGRPRNRCGRRGAHDRGRRHSRGHALAALGGRDARPPPGKCAGGPAVDLPVNARRIELVCRSPTLVRRRRSRRCRSRRSPCLNRDCPVRDKRSHLRQAIDARTLIGRAQGILMERFGIDDQAAFEVLRRHSQNTNTKLNEVARILVSSRALPKY